MFTTLIESRRKKDRRLGGTTVSVLLHAAVITFGVYITAQAREVPADTEPEIPISLATLPAPPVEKPTQPTDHADGPPPIKGLKTLIAPPGISTIIPPIDLANEITNPDDFSGKGASHGTADGTGMQGDGDHPYFEYQVEKPALAREGNPAPRYPSMLESSRVEGEVVAQFVVDTTGRADMGTLEILQSTNALFAASLESVLPRWRFYPAEAGGRRVKQIVQIPVRFVAPDGR